MTWLPKSVLCLSYYDRFRFGSDALAALLLSLQIFPLAIALAIATGVHPLYGISCAAMAALLASVFGESKIRVTAPTVVFVAVGSSIVAREGILALSLSTLLAGVLLVFFGVIGLGAAIRMLPRLSSSVSRRVSQSLSLASESLIFLASVHKSSPIQSHRQG
jgi:MFS superfamily sulfate permease-like transporter